MATRFPALTRRDQLKAWFCGFVDARHGIPAGEPTTGQDTPGSVTIAKRWEPLLDKISGQFHRIEAGYAVALLAGADAPTKALVPDVPAEGRAAGPDARSIRRAAERDAANASATNAAGDAARLAAIQAADQLLAEWNAFRCDALAVMTLSDRQIAIYTAAIHRWHKDGADLSQRGWHPAGLQPPVWIDRLRPDLEQALDRLGITYTRGGLRK